MIDPTWEEFVRNSLDKREIVIGYTYERPSPAAEALNANPTKLFEKIRAADPMHPSSKPIRTSFISPKGNKKGANHRPNVSAA